MSINHHYVSDNYHLVIDRISVASPLAKETEDGRFNACVAINIEGLSDHLAKSLTDIIIGSTVDNTFMAMVSDNAEKPVNYLTSGEALNEARMLSGLLAGRYSYGLLSTYGIRPSKKIEQSATLHFHKR